MRSMASGNAASDVVVAKPMAAGSPTAAQNRPDGNARQENDRHQHQEHEQIPAPHSTFPPASPAAPASAVPCCPLRMPAPLPQPPAPSYITIFVMRNMTSVSDCSTVTSGARRGSGSMASATPKSSAKTATCNTWFCATACAMFSGNTLSMHVLPSRCMRRRRSSLCRRGQRHAPSRPGEIDGDGPEKNPERRHHLKKDQRLERHATHSA